VPLIAGVSAHAGTDSDVLRVFLSVCLAKLEFPDSLMAQANSKEVMNGCGWNGTSAEAQLGRR
jgi:hypothetical protein